MTRVHFHSVNRYLRAITVKHVDFLCLSPELRVFTDITHCFFPHCAVSSKWNPSLCSLPPQAYFHFPVVCSRKCGSPKLGPTLYPPSLPGNGVPLPASHRQTISAAVAHCRRPPTSLRLQDTIISCPHCSVSVSLALFWSILHTVTGAIFFFFYKKASLILSPHCFKLLSSSRNSFTVYKPWVFWQLPNFPASSGPAPFPHALGSSQRAIFSASNLLCYRLPFVSQGMFWPSFCSILFILQTSALIWFFSRMLWL